MKKIVPLLLSKYIYDNKVPVLGEPMLNEQTKVDLKTQKEFEFIFVQCNKTCPCILCVVVPCICYSSIQSFCFVGISTLF